jgi:hypothetical protein
MLGARRLSVSVAAGLLAKAGLISYMRGKMTVLDRSGLEAASCECYGIIKGEFQGLVVSVREVDEALQLARERISHAGPQCRHRGRQQPNPRVGQEITNQHQDADLQTCTVPT